VTRENRGLVKWPGESVALRLVVSREDLRPVEIRAFLEEVRPLLTRSDKRAVQTAVGQNRVVIRPLQVVVLQVRSMKRQRQT
jgi:hypothetical protein